MKREKSALVVVDSLSLKHVLSDALKKIGYRIFAASNALSALQIANKQAINVLVADMSMYRMTGIELAMEIRNMNNNRNVHCVIVCKNEEQRKSFAENSDNIVHLIAYPIEPKDLTEYLINSDTE